MTTTAGEIDLRGDEPLYTPPEERIPFRSVDPADAWPLIGAGLSSLCLTWLIYERLTPLTGTIGFGIAWYATFLLIAWFVARANHDKLRARDQVVRIVMWSGGLALIVPLVAILGYIVLKGYHALHASFFTKDERFVGSLDKGTSGGARHAIIGTLEQVGIAMCISVPLGITTALYLNEIGGRLARPVRTIVDAMSALPSIVAGLFIYTSFVVVINHGQQNGLAGGLALAVMMLPTVTRTSEIVLRLVPGGLREAGLALGATDWRTTRNVVLPTARTGLVTAVILGLARVIGETAPLLLTIGGSRFVNWNVFKGQQSSLVLFVYNIFHTQTTAEQWKRGWTGALVLILLVLVLFVTARVIGGRGPAHIGRIKRWRLARKGLA
ncbi:MAG: phosphate transporter, permease protein PstA [Actinomycetia bacterium]|nr:phosphate transporter, permease protein PstA [Actinomycetes bacterium]